MTVRIEGETLCDVFAQLGRMSPADILIIFKSDDYGRQRKPGAIVDATKFGQEVPLNFETAHSAAQYIEMLLLKRDADCS